MTTPTPVPERRVDRGLVVLFTLTGLFWPTCFWAARTHPGEGPIFHQADAVTGCGELLVGDVTVGLWGVEIHDCAGANAHLQRELVDRGFRFYVARGPCLLREPDSAPAWDCGYADERVVMPEAEPPQSGPLAEPRVEGLVERFMHPDLWTAQDSLIRAGLARISTGCVADLEAATADPRRRWPMTCAWLWRAQCSHDHDAEADPDGYR